MKILLASLLFLLFISTSKVSAHVLMKDSSAGIGAIVHINPDDDPVAGSQTQMYIDIQDEAARFKIPIESYQVSIQRPDGARERPQANVAGSVLDVKYVFPTKGLYRIELTSPTSQARSVSMSYAVRVSRGVGQKSDKDTHSWTQYVLPVSSALLVVTLVYGFSNRKKILALSKF